MPRNVKAFLEAQLLPDDDNGASNGAKNNAITKSGGGVGNRDGGTAIAR